MYHTNDRHYWPCRFYLHYSQYVTWCNNNAECKLLHIYTFCNAEQYTVLQYTTFIVLPFNIAKGILCLSFALPGPASTNVAQWFSRVTKCCTISFWFVRQKLKTKIRVMFILQFICAWGVCADNFVKHVDIPLPHWLLPLPFAAGKDQIIFSTLCCTTHLSWCQQDNLH